MGGNLCLCVMYRLIHFSQYQLTIQYLLIFYAAILSTVRLYLGKEDC